MLDLELGIQLVGGAGFFGERLFLPGLKPAKADFGAAQRADALEERTKCHVRNIGDHHLAKRADVAEREQPQPFWLWLP